MEESLVDICCRMLGKIHDLPWEKKGVINFGNEIFPEKTDVLASPREINYPFWKATLILWKINHRYFVFVCDAVTPKIVLHNDGVNCVMSWFGNCLVYYILEGYLFGNEVPRVQSKQPSWYEWIDMLGRELMIYPRQNCGNIRATNSRYNKNPCSRVIRIFFHNNS